MRLPRASSAEEARWMGKLFLGVASAASVIALVALAWRITPQVIGAVGAKMVPGEKRVTDARKIRGAIVRERTTALGLPYPPREIFLRAFKHDAQLEVWAREDAGAFRLWHTYPVLTPSGGPGPKRRAGDRQVPEGFYRIDRFNPESRFHLSLGLDYPNAADRILSDRANPGGDIFIHGKDVTIGCLPLGDAAIEELYLLALDTRQRGQRTIPVHIFPARMAGENWETFRASQSAALGEFWKELQPAFDTFERTRRVPAITVDRAGRYSIGTRQ
jgi:murein L,D-transpeptidase YafK